MYILLLISLFAAMVWTCSMAVYYYIVVQPTNVDYAIVWALYCLAILTFLIFNFSVVDIAKTKKQRLFYALIIAAATIISFSYHADYDKKIILAENKRQADIVQFDQDLPILNEARNAKNIDTLIDFAKHGKTNKSRYTAVTVLFETLLEIDAKSGEYVKGREYLEELHSSNEMQGLINVSRKLHELNDLHILAPHIDSLTDNNDAIDNNQKYGVDLNSTIIAMISDSQNHRPYKLYNLVGKNNKYNLEHWSYSYRATAFKNNLSNPDWFVIVKRTYNLEKNYKWENAANFSGYRSHWLLALYNAKTKKLLSKGTLKGKKLPNSGNNSKFNDRYFKGRDYYGSEPTELDLYNWLIEQ